jgi:hypothetical protein
LSKAQKILPTSTKEAPKHKKLKFCQKLKTPHRSPPLPALLSAKPSEATEPKKKKQKPQFFSKAQNSSPQPKIEPKNFIFKVHCNKKKVLFIKNTHTHTHTSFSLSLSGSRSLTLSKHWDPFNIITSIIIIIIIKGQEECLQSKGVRRRRDFEGS